MQLDNDQCYTILCARDVRWDGVFFVAVSSTGIYCRPICPARTPAKERCTFFRDAAAAEQAGYRACLRCHPERAPGQAPVDAVPRLVRRAVARIESGALDEGSLPDFARSLGVTERHLRRVFEESLGLSPHSLARTRRVAIAKQLLAGSSLPIASVATAAGFRSERTFRSAFRSCTGAAPSAARRGIGDDPLVKVRLDTRPPFDALGLFAFLGERALSGIETIDTQRLCYRRVVCLGKHEGSLSVQADKSGVTVSLSPGLVPVVMQIVPRIRRLFDLDAQPEQVLARLGDDPRIGARVRNNPGLRLPGAFDPYELSVRAVLGQQISVKAATTLTRRLVEQLGRPIEGGLSFPSPDTLAATPIEALRAIGLPARRALSLQTLARAIADEVVDLGPGADVEEAILALCKLPGIGPWTASYIAMRGLGWPDAFPAGDLAVCKALGVRTARRAEQMSEPWRPWRAYAVLHLWTGGEL